MGKVINQETNPMIGKTVTYSDKGVRVSRTIILEKTVKKQRLYYVSDNNSAGVIAVIADIYDRLFKTTPAKFHRKMKSRSIIHRRRA